MRTVEFHARQRRRRQRLTRQATPPACALDSLPADTRNGRGAEALAGFNDAAAARDKQGTEP